MTDLSTIDITAEPDIAAEPSRRGLARSSLLPTYIGVGVVAVGFVLIAVAWSKVAGLANVALQMPYLVSAGITGLALVMVGLLVIGIAAKRQDGEELTRQVERLTHVLADLERAVQEQELRR
jgi:thiol:disulfide interchange protein